MIGDKIDKHRELTCEDNNSFQSNAPTIQDQTKMLINY